MGVKASALMMIVYWAFTFCVLMFGARTFALLFVDASELEILKNTELFLHISVSFFPVLGLLCILRYTIQGVGYTNLAMLSGVSEMIARILVSLLAVPAFGYLAVCLVTLLHGFCRCLFNTSLHLCLSADTSDEKN